MKQINRSHSHTDYSSNPSASARPIAPAIGRQNTNSWKKADPSSAAFAEKYPRPSFFDYRVRASGFERL